MLDSMSGWRKSGFGLVPAQHSIRKRRRLRIIVGPQVVKIARNTACGRPQVIPSGGQCIESLDLAEMVIAKQLVDPIDDAGTDIDFGRGIGDSTELILPFEYLQLVRPQQSFDVHS